MASSTYKQRSSSPFRYYKPASLDGNIPGLSHFLAPTSYSSNQFSGFNSVPRTRSLTPTSRRITSPAFSGGTFKFKFGSPSFAPRSIGIGGSNSPTMDCLEPHEAKENVAVTVRFRPLSLREIHRGDEVAWYADGDTTVRSEYNPMNSYAFDRVFGPATTTKGVYDVAAQTVVRGAMEGINGTVFAYGVTSSGKTHTMHGDHESPGIIPLAVKDVFSIIQETPGREYLLRVSYLEIYNEVINDLLDPAGQNLRIREDFQGTYVEGAKEEVVLSPAHALSLIAAGEEHRHVGSNNFNLLSSRSHTIFTLTIESSSQTGDCYEDEVTLSQLNLIDLAGSESSKTETTGLRRKEGSYINKSLLTLGTVIAKLSNLKTSHVPYRDSKLTRLLQSSLSGHGRVSLICTLTPASSNFEETHNTLKFAQRAKRVAIHAVPNRIMDERSLIKKYQKEITSLKEELEQLKMGIFDKSSIVNASQENLLALRQQLEAGQVKLQSRLEEEEQAKAALLGRIQRLTKLILVSTKTNTVSQGPEMQGHRRRHSFGEELNSFGIRKGAFGLGLNDDLSSAVHDLEVSSEERTSINGVDYFARQEKSKRWSMLGWFKVRKSEQSPAMSRDAAIFSNTSPGPAVSNTSQLEHLVDTKEGCRRSFSQKVNDVPSVADSFPECTQAGELFSSTMHGRRPPPTAETMVDQLDLLREHVKVLTGEVAFCTSSLKRMSEQALNNPDDAELQSQMEKTQEEIQEKKRQIEVLEQRIIETGQAALNNASPAEMSKTISTLMGQLNEKEFELEIKVADNRILEEQLHTKICEINGLQDTIASMQQQLYWQADRNSAADFQSYQKSNGFVKFSQPDGEPLSSAGFPGDFQGEVPEADGSDSESHSSKWSSWAANSSLQSQVLLQAAKIENLEQEKVCLLEANGGLHIQSQKLAEEASYARDLASAAAVELKNLAGEVTKLSFEKSELANDLAAVKEAAFSRTSSKSMRTSGCFKHISCHDQADSYFFMPDHLERAQVNRDIYSNDEVYDDIDSWKLDHEDVKRELRARKEREAGLEAALANKEQAETDLQKKLEDAKQREADLENDLAGMWGLVAKLKKEKATSDETTKTEIFNSYEGEPISISDNPIGVSKVSFGVQDTIMNPVEHPNQKRSQKCIQANSEGEKGSTAGLEALISQLRSEKLDGLHFTMLEELQNFHVEALTKLCQAKSRIQDKEMESGSSGSSDQQNEERNGHVCKVCFESPTAAVLLPCRHFCLCKPCAVACTECPLCRSGIADRIITFTS